MYNIIQELINKFAHQQISKEQFFNELHLKTGLVFKEEFYLEKLNEALNENDLIKTNIFISIGFILGFSHKAVPTLCKLLLSHSHYSHEDIASLLKGFADVITIEYLAQAVELEFEYLSYDDTYQFARKCIKALAAIDDEKAVGKLTEISHSQTKKISDYAKKELHYKGLI